MKKLNKKEKEEFINFIKEEFGETNTYDQNNYPLYFDKEGKMLIYDLEEGYNIYKLKLN